MLPPFEQITSNNAFQTLTNEVLDFEPRLTRSLAATPFLVRVSVPPTLQSTTS
jgi:hypothetical protein